MARNPRRSDPTGSYRQRVEESDAYENIAGMLPGIGTAMTITDIEDELKKEEPNYLKIGMLAGTEAIGLIPGLGTAAKSMIRKGADMARQTDEAINVASNVPKVAEDPFKKTRPAYKLFVKNDEKLYPLFVNAADEIPVNQWIEADFPDVAFKGKTKAGGEGWYVPTKGAKRDKGEKAKKTGDTITIPDEETRQKLIDAGFITNKAGRTKNAPFGRVTAVAARPGFHASTNPVAEHLGPQDIKISKDEASKLLDAGINTKAIRTRGDQYYVKRRAEDQFWAEVEMADDTSDELRSYMSERGRSDINDKVPKGGSYSYVDGQADGDTWVVGGDMKVSRVLSRDEAKAAQEAAGVKDLPYRDEIEEILGRKFANGGLVGEDMYSGQQDYLLAASSGMQMNEGGVATDEQMDAVFKSSRTDVDPVSGNEVPPGSLPEEVRDDIPAMISEGEYVVPADVLRFYGVKFFEDLRSQAKMGLAEMESNGRIGGEPIEEGTGEVGISDEDLMAIMAQAPQEEPQQVAANRGGLMGFQQGGLSFPEYIKQPDISQFGMAGPDFQGGLEYRKFVNDAGMTMTIPFFNGEPMGMIPPGYTEGDAPTATEEAEQDRRDDNDGPVRPPVPVKDEFDLDAIPTEKLEQTAKGLSTMNSVATGLASFAGLPFSALVNTAGVARYNDVLDRLEAEDPEAFKKSGLERKGSIFGGESGLFEGLKDRSDEQEGNKPGQDFGDTWLGDLLGFDGEAGVQGPGLKESFGGARRTEKDDSSSEETAAAPETELTDAERYERHESMFTSASGDRVDRERQEQRIRDIVSGALQPKDIDEEREFNAVISAAAG